MHAAGFRLLQLLSSSETHYAYLAVDVSNQPFRIYGARGTGILDESFSRLQARIRRAAIVEHPGVMPIRLLCDDAKHCQAAVSVNVLDSWVADSHERLYQAPVEYLLEVAGVLAAAHRIGAAHGCLSPERLYWRDRELDGRDAAGAAIMIDLLEFLIAPANYSDSSTPRLSAQLDEDSRSPIALMACDIADFGRLIEWLMSRATIDSKPRERLQTLATDCTIEDWTSRPTIGRVVSQLADFLQLGRSAPEAASGSVASDRSVTNLQDATVEVQAIAPASSSVQSPVHPAKIGRFAIERPLGEGAMGAVYLGRDQADGSQVAIKVLTGRVARNERAALRFAKEARMLSTLNHPSIARLIEFNSESDQMYLAMEFVEGGNLSDILKNRQFLSERLSLALIADAARGLSVAHQSHMVHRDIKPANLLLTRRGQLSAAQMQVDETISGPLVKLADFGLAKHHDVAESIALTQTGMILGTPHYMSPEQCRGGQVDPATDVYSLGATLFQCLTGRPPYEGDSTVAVIRQHCDAPIPNLRAINAEISDAVQRLVERSLAKNPALRQQNAGELLADVEGLLNGEPSSLVLHPAIPDRDAPGILNFRYEWDLRASPAALWPHLSNTDRVNHAIGLPTVKYKTFVDPKLGVRRMATARVMGMSLEWEEHPYEWVEGRRLSVLRQFLSGPFHWFVNIVELKPQSGGGTHVVQQLQMLPRNMLGRMFAKYEIGRKSGTNFGRVYERIDEYLLADSFKNPTNNPFAKSRPMSRQQLQVLEHRLQRARSSEVGVDPDVLEVLRQYLQHAPDLEVARIRPLAFAERFGLNGEAVVQACLLLAREGVLVLLWDILCPTCRIPSDNQETLKNLENHGHCEACNVDFELDFAQSVELVFRVHREVRQAETRTYCIGGPAFSSHVVVQTRLVPGERLCLEVELSDGQYRLRGPQLPFVIDMRVAASGRTVSWEVDLTRPVPRSAIPVLKSGTQVLVLNNSTANLLQVRLERLASRVDALTAADASRLPAFRQWFPNEVLSPGQMVSLTTVTLLACQIGAAESLFADLGDAAACSELLKNLQRLSELVVSGSGCVTKTMNDTVFAVFPTVLSAVETASELQRSAVAWNIPLKQAISHGPAIVATINDRLDYFGNTSQMLVGLLKRASEGEMWLSEQCLSEPGVLAAIHRDWETQVETYDVTRPDLTAFRARIKANVP